MTVGPDGNLYVGIHNGLDPRVEFAIRRFDGQTGALIDTFAFGGGLQTPFHLVFGPDGNLYVASPFNSKVIGFNGSTGAYMGDFVPAGSGGLEHAEGLVFGPDGNLYVTSRDTNEVLRYDGATGAFMDVFAAERLSHPIDLHFGPDEDLYVLGVATSGLQVVRFHGLTGAFIDVFVSQFRYSPDFEGCGIGASSVAFGPDGNLYVTTGTGNSVWRFDGSMDLPERLLMSATSWASVSSSIDLAGD
jgi:DNA-binding beta-propeller fold protein YncE